MTDAAHCCVRHRHAAVTLRIPARLPCRVCELTFFKFSPMTLTAFMLKETFSFCHCRHFYLRGAGSIKGCHFKYSDILGSLPLTILLQESTQNDCGHINF
jgi:hypothetical protein